MEVKMMTEVKPQSGNLCGFFFSFVIALLSLLLVCRAAPVCLLVRWGQELVKGGKMGVLSVRAAG